MMFRSLLPLSFLAFGCALPVDDVSAVEQAVNCPSGWCGSNSPEVDNLGMHEGNVRGLPNENGFRLRDVVKDHKSYRMEVTGAQVLLRPVDGGLTLWGPQVKGALMLFSLDGSQMKYEIRITDVLKTTYWARQNGVTHSVYTYQLDWSIVNEEPLPPTTGKIWKNICTKAAPANPATGDGGDMNGFHALIFEGDRIDPVQKFVKGVDTDWFNIGCAGHLLAKMHLTGHTHAAKVANGYVTTLDERTTMVKMLSAAYCGDGQVFTVAGVKLYWKDDKQWMQYLAPVESTEARWTPNGAQCLNTPRIIANPTPDSLAEFGHVTESQFRQHINDTCGRVIPPCGQWSAIYHLTSANPW